MCFRVFPNPIPYPLVREFTLKHVRDPSMIWGIFPIQGPLGSLGRTKHPNCSFGNSRDRAPGNQEEIQKLREALSEESIRVFWEP